MPRTTGVPVVRRGHLSGARRQQHTRSCLTKVKASMCQARRHRHCPTPSIRSLESGRGDNAWSLSSSRHSDQDNHPAKVHSRHRRAAWGTLKALLALEVSDTRSGIVARSTRHTWASTARKNSRIRNWPARPQFLTRIYASYIMNPLCCVALGPARPLGADAVIPVAPAQNAENAESAKPFENCASDRCPRFLQQTAKNAEIPASRRRPN